MVLKSKSQGQIIQQQITAEACEWITLESVWK